MRCDEAGDDDTHLQTSREGTSPLAKIITYTSTCTESENIEGRNIMTHS